MTEVRDYRVATVDEAAAALRAGAVTSAALTRACLDQVGHHDSRLNSFVTVMEESALAASEVADRKLEAGQDLGPFHGIPVAVKDLIDVCGVHTTCGSPARAKDAAHTDAPVVRRLRDAGAVIIGKTNLIELAYIATHPRFRRTNNPWDPSRVSGASSGGSAVAVATGMCFAALGSDTGGSIRVPAAHCGIVGLKPTYDLVETTGVVPLSRSLDTVGPMARSCGDAARMLAVLTGRPCDIEASLHRKRIAVLHHPAWDARRSPAVARAFADARAVLRELGATLTEFDVAELDSMSAAHMDIELPEASVAHGDLLESRAGDLHEETRAALEKGLTVSATAYIRAQGFRRSLRAAFMKVLDETDLLVSPTCARVAPEQYEGSMDGVQWTEVLFTQPFNQTGLPALSVPCALSAEGLPIGLQIASRPYAEALVLGAGAALEAALGRFTPPLVRGWTTTEG